MYVLKHDLCLRLSKVTLFAFMIICWFLLNCVIARADTATLSGTTYISRTQNASSDSYHHNPGSATAYAALSNATGNVTVTVEFKYVGNCSKAKSSATATATINGISNSVSGDYSKANTITEDKTIVLNVGSTPVSGNVEITLSVDPGITCDQGGDSSSMYLTLKSVTYTKAHTTHDYSVFVKTVTAATCTSDRVDQYKCSGCSLTTNKTITGTALGHNFTETNDNTHKKANATTSAKAQYWNKCSRSGCGAYASSGSYYHEVGYPLVKYSSGVPTSKTYVYGDTVTLTATFTNAKSYQWYKDGASMGASYRSATLNLGKQTSPSLSGKYKCIATGYNGNTGLNTATTATSTECTISANTSGFKPTFTGNLTKTFSKTRLKNHNLC